MSYSFEQTADQAAYLHRYLNGFSDTEVVLQTNKRMVIKCPDQSVAKNLSYNLRSMNYSCQTKQGLQSSAWYVQVPLSPF